MTVRIDAHHHLWTAGYAWLAEEELAPIRRAYTMDDLRPHLDGQRTVLVEAGRGDDAETTEFLDLAARTPEIAGVVGWADLTDPKLQQKLAAYDKTWLKGVRDQIQRGPDDLLDQPAVRKGLRTVAEAGLLNELVVRPEQLKSVARAAAQTDSLFVLDHLGKPPIKSGDLREWRRDITAVAKCPNVVAKLSGLVTEAGPGWTVEQLRPCVETALDVFGRDRLMFGSDWPVCELVSAYGKVRDAIAQLVGPDPGGVFGANAARIYGL